jgi:hypothetical protein
MDHAYRDKKLSVSLCVFRAPLQWLAYWVLPIPNQFGSLWVNFNSPLLWDVFAISTFICFTSFLVDRVVA